MNALSDTDLKLLQLLQEDASQPTQELADKVNISQSPCWRRISRLETEGYIRGKVALLDRQKLEIDLVAFVTVNLRVQSGGSPKEFEQAVVALPEVMEIYGMTGIWDYAMKVMVRDIRHYETFIQEKFRALPHLGTWHSHIALSELKYTTALPL